MTQLTDLFRMEIFFNTFMGKHWWKFHLLLLIPSKKIILNNNFDIKNWQCCLKRRPRDIIYFPLNPLEAALSIPTFCFLFKRATKLFLLIYTLLILRWTPEEIIQHQALEISVFNVYQFQNAVNFVDKIFCCILGADNSHGYNRSLTFWHRSFTLKF
jgi:hypothetical protein